MSVYHNVNGVIKEVTDIYENVNGVIHKIDSRYQNVNGVIRQTYGGKKFLIDTNGKYQNGFKFVTRVTNVWSFTENKKFNYVNEDPYYALQTDCVFKYNTKMADRFYFAFPDNINWKGRTLHFDILRVVSFYDVNFAYFRIATDKAILKTFETTGKYENVDIAIPTTATNLDIYYGISGSTSLVTSCSNVCHFSGVYIK